MGHTVVVALPEVAPISMVPCIAVVEPCRVYVVSPVRRKTEVAAPVMADPMVRFPPEKAKINPPSLASVTAPAISSVRVMRYVPPATFRLVPLASDNFGSDVDMPLANERVALPETLRLRAVTGTAKVTEEVPLMVISPLHARDAVPAPAFRMWVPPLTDSEEGETVPLTVMVSLPEGSVTTAPSVEVAEPSHCVALHVPLVPVPFSAVGA